MENLTPPPELVQHWYDDARDASCNTSQIERKVAACAAQWGADQELEACCLVLEEELSCFVAPELPAARRLPPPSLAEEALRAYERSSFHYPGDKNKIRRAIERLQQLEDQQ